MARIAVVLFNLGGPDRIEAVRPFLFNLFADPAILRVPALLRRPLAWAIARRRAPIARDIYAKLGGRSPLLDGTRAQAQALESRLRERLDDEVGVFVSMRYWHPFSAKVAREVAGWRPERIVLLPLYPQFSTTTTASSLTDWHRAAAASGLAVPSQAICCWPTAPGFIEAIAILTRAALGQLRAGQAARILFSAHGLPKGVVMAGDPYAWQVRATAKAVASALDTALGPNAPESVVCYQSRVGPLEWIGPATEDEIARAGREGKALVVVPIAFVSEHSETLVELDIDYRERASAAGVPAYVRVATVGVHPAFIECLADLVATALSRPQSLSPGADIATRLCPARFRGCACPGGGTAVTASQTTQMRA